MILRKLQTRMTSVDHELKIVQCQFFIDVRLSENKVIVDRRQSALVRNRNNYIVNLYKGNFVALMQTSIQIFLFMC